MRLLRTLPALSMLAGCAALAQSPAAGSPEAVASSPGTGSPEPGASLSYECDPGWNLRINVLAASGTQTARQVSMASPDACAAAARQLAATRREASRPTIVGVCDPRWNVQRFGVMPDGRVVDLPAKNGLSPGSCEAAARATNRAHRPASGPSTVLDYDCDPQWNLRLLALTSEGARSEATVRFMSPSACEQNASALRSTRSEIDRAAQLGVCDTSWNVQRFSVTPTSGLQPLQTLSMPSPGECTKQAAAINQQQ